MILQHKGSQVLQTPRLMLRPFALSDADAMFNNWAKDPRVTRFLTWQTHPDLQESLRILNLWQPDYESLA